MSVHPETNPHFGSPHYQDDQHSQFPYQQNQPPGTFIRRPQHQVQEQPKHQDRSPTPLGPSAESLILSLHPAETNPHFLTPQNEDQHSQFPRQGLTSSQHQAFPLNPQLGSGMSGSPGPRTKKPRLKQGRERPIGSGMSDSLPGSRTKKPRLQHERVRLLVPGMRTNPILWFVASLCAIFWLLIILGGLTVTILCLLLRSHSPQFPVPSVNLNATKLDMNATLNVDITVLANFTNPNKKVKVDFTYVVIHFYYGNTLIASQHVRPFTAPRAESKLAKVHIIKNQVTLPPEESQRLKTQISRNAIVFQVKGLFRARDSLGSFLRYSYGLHGHCTILASGPPRGVIRASNCKTKL